MRQSFIIVFNGSFATRDKVTAYLDELDPKGDWHTPFDNCVFFTSEYSAQQLASAFESKFGFEAGKFFLILTVSGAKQGRLSGRAWRVLNNPYNPRAK